MQFLLGDADLQDNRPTSALGEFNRLLKVYPRSDKLDKTLFEMGEAYLQLHDCANAKLAFGAVEQRFAREKIGVQAKAKARGDRPPGARDVRAAALTSGANSDRLSARSSCGRPARRAA